MSVKTEWKTIRVDAGTYYKLNELSGLWTFILGSQTTLTAIAQLAISEHYVQMYPKLRELISDPDELNRRKQKIRETMLELAKNSDGDVARTIYEYFNVDKDRERDV